MVKGSPRNRPGASGEMLLNTCFIGSCVVVQVGSRQGLLKISCPISSARYFSYISRTSFWEYSTVNDFLFSFTVSIRMIRMALPAIVLERFVLLALVASLRNYSCYYD